jgi:uncharacterized protein YcfJ
MALILVSIFCTVAGFIVGGFALLPKSIQDDTIVQYINQRGETVYAKTVGHQYEGTTFVVVQRCDDEGEPLGIVFALDADRLTWKDSKGTRWTNKVFSK